MTVISAQLVKELRERTSAGFMECKNALAECGGDIEQAVLELRKRGQAKADKKGSRIAAEGIVVMNIADDAKRAALVEVNCETDFVARDESFVEFAKASAIRALASRAQDVEALIEKPLLENQAETIGETRQALVAKIGENIQIRRLANLEAKQGKLYTYLHGTRIGVILELQGGDAELGKGLAMHIAASKPKVIAPSEVPAELIEQEKEIFMVQAKESGKPDAIIAKMVDGRINKFLEEVSLLGQAYIRDPNTSVAALLKNANANVIQFVRFEVGEGIEKKADNFVEEVMAQVKGSS